MLNNNFLSRNKFSWVYLLGIFFILTLPLWSLAPWFHPPTWSKAVLLKVVLSALLFFFIYQVLFKGYEGSFSFFKRAIFNRKSSIFWPFWFLACFFLFNLLATIFSLDFHYSFWGSPYRGGGFLNLAFYIILGVFVFLIARPKDWQRLLDFSILVGIIVAMMGVFQKFSLLSKFIVPYTWRPVSSIGGPMFLALYLLLLVFLSLSFGIIAKNKKKKVFYFFSLALFLFVVFLTATRSVFLGIFVGFLFFIFFYPVRGRRGKKEAQDPLSSNGVYPSKNLEKKIKRRIFWLKILTGIILILGILGVNWLQGQPQIVETLSKGDVLGPGFYRLWSSIGDFSIDKIAASRGSGWKVALMAVKDRPILGYGPENFSIGFDKYYDPNLSGIVREPGGAGSTGWWDRAHNFILDIVVTAGIPALLAYLCLFTVLFWQLQRVKRNANLRIYANDGDTANVADVGNDSRVITAHGIQATFIAYLTANLFNFDVFSTYLLLFLLVGYSFFVIYKKRAIGFGTHDDNPKAISSKDYKPWRYILIFILTIVLIWFIWSVNLKPLKINKDLNMATFHSINNNQCGKAIEIDERLFKESSIIDNYFLLSYIDVLSQCSKQHPARKVELSRRSLKILEDAMQSRPYYTRIWLYFNSYANIMLDEDKEMDDNTRTELIEEAYYAIEKAHQLSPKRQEIYLSWIKTDIEAGHLEDAERRTDECIAINPKYPECWWAKALIYINRGDIEGGSKYMRIAEEKGLEVDSTKTLGQLLKAYISLIEKTGSSEYYLIIVEIYKELIETDYENFQYHASLAHVYKLLGQYDKAREEALVVYELSPESIENIRAFLNTLPPPYNTF